MTRIGFVGVGDMGSRMVPRLLEAGHPVTVFDIAPKRVAAMVASGATAAATAAAAARYAEMVISSVMSAESRPPISDRTAFLRACGRARCWLSLRRPRRRC